MTQAPLAELEREITRLFRRSRAQSAALAAEVHPDLEANGYVVLQWLLESTSPHSGQPDGVRASDLAEFLRAHKSTTSRTVNELERLGLLERVVDPTDARARLLTLSAQGRTAVTRSRDARRARIASVLTRWPAEDLRQLAHLLGRLNDDFS